ncbi:zf-HC2 domain-containing protein [Agaribacterium haliotis]|uniref:zf-HC2 domain-containing protein n=1 Tax=Agaribacterium haliotis TaxID=2013869 RepID=UPI000BB59401|nr:zf-HC2 domain-containing protein [Agaribacterium haliotis]
MLSCREVTRLLSLAQERKLNFSERMQLKMHLMMCKRCKSFSGNLNTLRKAMQKFKQRDD